MTGLSRRLIGQSGPMSWGLLGVFIVAAMVIYWPGLRGGFIFDDLPNLVRNDTWKVDNFDVSSVLAVLDSDISGAIGRPLAMLSFSLNHAWTGMDPFWLKLTNLVMHLANGVLVFIVCRHLLAIGAPEAVANNRSFQTAALVAGAWLLHPLQTSTVLYVVQRMEIGAALGILGCLAGYLMARRRTRDRSRGLAWYGLAGVMFMLGLGFKESALLALPLLLLVELLILDFKTTGERRSRRLLTFHIAWLVPALLAYSAFVVPAAFQGEGYAHRDFDVVQRLLAQGPILGMYLDQIMLPIPDGMLFYYDHIRPPTLPAISPMALISLGLVAGLVALAWVARRRSPLTALGILWFFSCHALTSNVIGLELAFEHRNYLALLGPLLVVCDVLLRTTRRLHGDAATTIGLVLLLMLAALCAIQTNTWADPFRLSVTLASRNPESPRANYALGVLLHKAAEGDRTSPQWSLALRQFQTAAMLPGSSALGDQALIVMSATGSGEFPEAYWLALEHKLLAGPLHPDNVSALHSVVACRLNGACQLPDPAVSALLQRVQIRHPESHVVAIIRANFMFNGLRDQAGAIELLKRWRSEAKTAAPPSLELALAQFLMASNLHENQMEAELLLAAMSRRNLNADDRAKVQDLQAKFDAMGRQPAVQ